ncbi:MAG: metallophosphoesterase [Actinomycetota bacterium]|nr:metallophosphoesterase [Actinomycetota bacterium]
MTEDQFEFRRRRSVRWFSPGVLASAGLRVVLSAVFGAFLDKRELQAVAEASLIDHLSGRDELWLDYLSDTGDGFDPTYTMAWLASRPALEVAGADKPLPRGDALVLGGDEVYPTADPAEYEDRFVGPFRCALPWLPEHRAPDMFVLPGNHDWYDGLTGFIRIFCQKKWVGAWRTRQARSYFALQLPHRWWLWGIDIQLDSYIDEPQLRYFEGVAEAMRAGDRVILCTAKPSWVDTVEEPAAYRNLAYLERNVIRPTEARLMLTLTGDHHHYARYEGPDGTQKVTAGGGGAFLHPTHDLPGRIDLEVDKRDASPQTYIRRASYPQLHRSRRMGLGAVRLPFRNPSFMLIPGALHLLLLWTSQFSIRTLEGGTRGPLPEAVQTFGLSDLLVGLWGPASGAVLVVLAMLLIAFAEPPARWRARLAAKVVMGLAHGALQLAAVVGVAWISVGIATRVADGGLLTVALLGLVAVLGGLAGGLAMGVYLAACNVIPGLDTHGNEAFSAQRLTGCKNFARLHIDHEGVLRLYPIGVERTTTKWRLDPGGEPSASWLAPDGGAPRPHLIEGPTVIDGRGAEERR